MKKKPTEARIIPPNASPKSESTGKFGELMCRTICDPNIEDHINTIFTMCPFIIGKLTEICTKNHNHKIPDKISWKNENPEIEDSPAKPPALGSPPAYISGETEPKRNAVTPVKKVR